MRRLYYYQICDVWMTCFASSKAQVRSMFEGQPEEVLTEREAERRAQNDSDLANYIQCAHLCDLMCN